MYILQTHNRNSWNRTARLPGVFAFSGKLIIRQNIARIKTLNTFFCFVPEVVHIGVKIMKKLQIKFIPHRKKITGQTD